MSAAICHLPSGNTEALPLVQLRGQMRVDSRIIAAGLGQTHQHVRELIEKHARHFELFGVLRFETGKPAPGSTGGRPERFVLLTEDQCYFLLTLSRNTDRVVALKVKLVMAFRDARSRQVLHDGVYLPSYHALHDEVEELVRRAQEAGSLAGGEVFHCNVNRLANKVCGLARGQRERLTPAQRAVLTATQEVIRASLRRSHEAGQDHSTAYLAAKAAAASFAAASRLVLEE